MLYFLSRFIPVRMRSSYRFLNRHYKSTWWQWRDYIWLHKKEKI